MTQVANRRDRIWSWISLIHWLSLIDLNTLILDLTNILASIIWLLFRHIKNVHYLISCWTGTISVGTGGESVPTSQKLKLPSSTHLIRTRQRNGGRGWWGPPARCAVSKQSVGRPKSARPGSRQFLRPATSLSNLSLSLSWHLCLRLQMV